jgi:tetratricopeptide (TPR) repeat protein
MGGGSAGQQRLDSWKEIGAFFGRDERTAKRWERERGLPVHRVPGSGRGRVYAYPAELTEWLQSTGFPPGGTVADEIEGVDQTVEPEPTISSEPQFVSRSAEPAASPHIQIQPEMAERYKPVVSDYEQAGFARSGESPVRMPDPMPRLSLVQPKTVQPRPRAEDETRALVAEAANVSADSGEVPAAQISAPVETAAPSRVTPARIWIGATCAVVLVFAGAWGAHHELARQRTASAAEQRDRAANAEAENLYLQGKYYWQQRTPDGLTKAVDLFTQAIVHDPHYAPAYAGLAECYDLLREYTSMPDKEAFPRAISAAERAIQLNPNLAQAHSALAFALFYWTWDTKRALAEFDRAQELDPNSATTHHWYANSLMTAGKSQEAMAQIEEARKLDPGSRAILADKGWMLANAGQTEAANELLQQVEQADPNFYSPHEYLARIAFTQGDGVTYVRELRKAAELRNDPERARLANVMEKAYADGGAEGMRKAWAADIRERFAAGKTGPYQMACLEARDGHRDAALRLLELAYAKRDPNMRNLMLDSEWSEYRSDPRFQSLVQKMGVA